MNINWEAMADSIRKENAFISPFDKFIFMSVQSDKSGGWGGPLYPQKCDEGDDGAVRYVREDVAIAGGYKPVKGGA